MKENNALKTKLGTKNPFRTPEAYFDTFTERLMQQLPEQPEAQPAKLSAVQQPPATLFTRIKPYLYLAAMFGGLYFGIHVFKYQASLHTVATPTATATSTFVTDEYVDDLCNFAMMDESTIFDCLTSDYSY